MRRWALRLLPLVLLLVGVAVLLWSILEGHDEQRAHPGLKLGAAPLVSRNDDGWNWRFSPALIGAAFVAALVAVGWWRGWWQRARQRWVVPAAAFGASVFAVLLALTDGLEGLRYGAAHDTEYLANLADAPPAGAFVRTFVDRINDYTVHVRGHPPGFVLLLKVMDAIGLRGVWPVVGLTVLATGLTAAAVLVAVRAVAGELWMRRAAPLLVVAPYSIWMMTSGDAVFTCLGALAVAAVAEGVARPRRQALALGLLAGLLFGVLLYMTYLGAVFLALPLVLLVAALVRRERGTWWVVLGGVGTGLVVVAAFWIAGFWWFDGVAATNTEYREGSAQFRMWSYFALGNIGAALFAIGPIAVAGLGVLRSRRLWLLVGAGILALTVSHLSHYTKGEVERIWLLFYPWIVIVGAALLANRRRWVGVSAVSLQALCAIVLQAGLVSKW
jgi:methylthioxylose transferase